MDYKEEELQECLNALKTVYYILTQYDDGSDFHAAQVMRITNTGRYIRNILETVKKCHKVSTIPKIN